MNGRLPFGPMVLTGNEAAALAFGLANPDAFGGYPITPSTEVTEEIAELALKHIIDTTYRNLDSELASIAFGIGVSTARGRYGTATSSQGLALMCELLHWASTARLPIFIANVNRSLGSPWSIHPDQSDSLLFRDMFLLQFYCKNVQEVLDMVLWAYRIAEGPGVSLPALVCFDGFMLSHTAENIIIPSKEKVLEFLPKRTPSENFNLPQYRADEPRNISCPTDWMKHQARKRSLVDAMQTAEGNIRHLVRREWTQIFGGAMQYEVNDGFFSEAGNSQSDTAVISMGAIAGTIEEATRGEDIGLISLRVFRPFPAKALHAKLVHCKKIVVFDRSILPSGEGIIANELRSRTALFPQQIYGFVGGFGGQNLSEKDFLHEIRTAMNSDHPEANTYWIGDKS